MSIPGSGSPLLLATTAAAAAAEYVIPKSLRFNSGDSAYLNRTPSSAGNRRTWTWSAWVKKADTGVERVLFNAHNSSDSYTRIRYVNTNQFQVYMRIGSGTNYYIRTTGQHRDHSAWYHLVVAVDTTQATAANRVKLYVNGVEAALDQTIYPPQNGDTAINSTLEHSIGSDYGSNNFDGQMADIQLVDGQALAPTDFGETRSSDGVWVPKEYTGSYGAVPVDYSSNNQISIDTGNFYLNNQDGPNAFDGNSSTYIDCRLGSGANTTTNIIFAPTGGISSVTKIRVHSNYATHYRINEGTWTSFTSNGSYTQIYSGSAFTLTKLEVRRNNNGGSDFGHRVTAYEINDSELLNVSGNANGFHLNFSDSSTNEALGFDSAPTIPDLDPKKGMDIVTWTGNGTAGTNIGGLGFEPDFVWIKRRSAAYGHVFSDSVRGFGATGWAKQLIGNSTEVENTGAVNTVSSFNPDGFTIGTDGGVNLNSSTYVGWCWRAGGPAVANTDGTITSQVSANTDYGFSIVTVTPTATGQTVGHGLSATPSWIIYKNRDTAGNWRVHHTSLGTSKTLFLNTNGAESTSSDRVTAVTSSTFTLGDIVANDDHVAYCWSEVSGFSKFGSYTGTSSTVTVTTGFKPRWVLVKNTTTGSLDWVVVDSERSNADAKLFPNTTAAESAQDAFDFNDDGFTIKVVDYPMNKNGDTFIYAAFADRPGNNWDVNNIVTNEGLTTSKTQFDVLTYTGNGGAQHIGAKPSSGAISGSGTPANASGTGGWAQAFDGSTSTLIYVSGGTGTVTSKLTLPAAIPFTKLRIYAGQNATSGTNIQANDVNLSASHTWTLTGSWVDVTSSVTSPLTSLALTTVDGNSSNIRAIEINDVIVVESDSGSLKFQPDFVWIKTRSHSQNHGLFDSVRGAGRSLRSSTTGAEQGPNTGTNGDLTSFNSDGFTVGSCAASGAAAINNNGQTQVAWCWKAGGTAVSNTDGTITSSVSANAQYGFSIVSYSGDGSGTANSDSGDSFGHGLNSAPKLVICKKRTGTNSWPVYHASTDLGALILDGTNALDTSSFLFAKKHPTESVVYLGNNPEINKTGDDYIAYCFANVPGYQRIGSYTGNGSSTGPVVVTGFKPRFLLIKRTDAVANWYLLDTERDSSNPVNALLRPNISDAEISAVPVDILQSGFQPKDTDFGSNASGGTYIYLAIGDDEIGSEEDCLVDVPNAVSADADATDTTGGYQRGNYATLNPLTQSSQGTIENGNLEFKSTSSQWGGSSSTIGMQSGKFYMEVNGGSKVMVGITSDPNSPSDGGYHSRSDSYTFYSFNGNKVNTDAQTSYSSAWTSSGDVASALYDADNGTLSFYVNGVSQGNAFTSIDTTKTWHFVAYTKDTTAVACNFGQMRFKYPMPSGYAALNTTALPAATIEDGSAYFDTLLWTGDNAVNRTLTGLEFSPDFVWHQARSIAWGSGLVDAVRGVGSGGPTLRTFNNSAEETVNNFGAVTALTSDGFTVSKGGFGSSQWAYVNQSGATYVAWAWDAGSSTVSNTDGSITSSVRANPSAGFSIVKFSGPSSAGFQSVGHGLNAKPEFIICKDLDNSRNWSVYHKDSQISDIRVLPLNQNVATFNSGTATWDISEFSNTTFTPYFRDDYGASFNADNIAYCFAPVAGYSAFGSYTGNGSSDGPFVYTGFRPALVICRPTTTTGSWQINDSARNAFNVADEQLFANESIAATTTSNRKIDFLSNGFKVRGNNTSFNGSGHTYIYIAFAENPFQANGGLAR